MIKRNDMGVKACYRDGCDNVMCDTYIPDKGYICSDCQKDFMEWARAMQHHPYTRILSKQGLVCVFLDNTAKPPQMPDDKVKEWEDFFEKHTS